MKLWVIQLCSTIILTAICEIILPNGKTQKTCKIALSLITLAVLIRPVFILFENNYDFNNIFEDTVYSDYVINIDSYAESLVEKDVINHLRSIGVQIDDCTVIGELVNGEFKVDLIEINLLNDVINGEEEHIFSNERIIDVIVTKFNVDKERVVIFNEQ